MNADLLPEYQGPERRRIPERRADFCPVHESNLETLSRIETKLDKFDDTVVPTVHENNGTVKTLKWIGAVVAGCALFIAAMVFDISGYITKHKFESEVGFTKIGDAEEAIDDLKVTVGSNSYRINRLEEKVDLP